MHAVHLAYMRVLSYDCSDSQGGKNNFVPLNAPLVLQIYFTVPHCVRQPVWNVDYVADIVSERFRIPLSQHVCGTPCGAFAWHLVGNGSDRDARTGNGLQATDTVRDKAERPSHIGISSPVDSSRTSFGDVCEYNLESCSDPRPIKAGVTYQLRIHLPSIVMNRINDIPERYLDQVGVLEVAVREGSGESMVVSALQMVTLIKKVHETNTSVKRFRQILSPVH